MNYTRLSKKIITTLILIICVIVVFLASFFCYFNIVYPKKYSIYINNLSEKYSVDKILIYSVINIESGFNVNATSSKGAMGLMQIMPATAVFIAEQLNIQNFNTKNLYNPETNIEFGTFYLNYLSQKFENLDAVICSYNAGETIVRRWLTDANYSSDGKTLNKIPYSETANYLKKVKQNYKVYKKLV